jgi:hypothetical protein
MKKPKRQLTAFDYWPDYEKALASKTRTQLLLECKDLFLNYASTELIRWHQINEIHELKQQLLRLRASSPPSSAPA